MKTILQTHATITSNMKIRWISNTMHKKRLITQCKENLSTQNQKIKSNEI